MGKASNKNPETKAKWELSGIIFVGRRRIAKASAPFKIVFTAFSPSHALKIAMERLKAYARRKKDSEGEKKFYLDGVFVASRRKTFALKSQFSNNSVLFAKNPRTIFECLHV